MINATVTPLEKLLAQRELSQSSKEAADSQVLRQLLSELRAPEMLQGGAKVFRAAYRLLLRSLLVAEDEERSLLSSYIDELAWIYRNIDDLSTKIFSEPIDREHFFACSDHRVVRLAGVEEHAIWCLLWEHHPERKQMRGFRSLQLQAMLAHFSIIRHWSSQANWKPGKTPATTILNSLYTKTTPIAKTISVTINNTRSIIVTIPNRISYPEKNSVSNR